MDFFNSLIENTNELLGALPRKSLPYNKNNDWADLGYNQVILQRDTAFELGGTGFHLVTSNEINDEIVIIGKDLSEIKTDCKFARISLVQIEDTADEQKAYNLIRKIEYVKYHYFPDGYMIRTSSRSHKEAVRVSKNAIKNGISFERVGNLLINKYKEIPAVKSVKLIFVTDENADYNALSTLAQKNNQITETLNHIMNNVNFDCSTCNLKPICDEVEGMKELHFKTSMGK